VDRLLIAPDGHAPAGGGLERRGCQRPLERGRVGHET
jgi:hypothetical protein